MLNCNIFNLIVDKITKTMSIVSYLCFLRLYMMTVFVTFSNTVKLVYNIFILSAKC